MNVACQIVGIFGVSIAIIFLLLWRKEKKHSSSLESLSLERRFKIADLQKAVNAAEEKLKPKPTIVPLSPDWLASDVLELRKFYNSETGKKFRERGRANEYANAVAGCNDSFHTIHSAAKASGFGECLNWQDSLASEKMYQELSQATGAQVANQNTSDIPQDEDALLEKYSP